MRRSARRLLSLAIAAGALGGALPALSQQERVPVLRGNPYRDIGGSCVYGRQGELLFAPDGARCASRQETAPDDPQSSDRFKSLSPTLRAEMMDLLAVHSHVAEELVKLRRAVAEGRKEDALEASDHVVQELTDHLVREDRLFEKLLAR